MATMMPRNWRRLTDNHLRALLREMPEEDDAYELVEEELDLRESMRGDDRLAEMMGAPWLEPS